MTIANHLAAIADGTVSKTNVIGIRKVLNHVERLQRGYSGNRINATRADAAKLESAILKHEPTVTGDLHDSGLKLLRSPRYAKRLAPVADIIANIESFRLAGYVWRGPSEMQATPFYRAVAGDGRSFLFVNVAWQSGGNGPELIK